MVYDRSKKFIKATYFIIVNLIIFFFLFAIFEASARLIFPKEDRLGQILYILEQDPVLFWRQKANIKVRFQGVEVKTNFLGLRDKRRNFKKAKNTFRIVCLGASPTFGWAVKYEDTYPYQLERMLKDKLVEEKVYEIINAGIVGYTSYQGLILLKKEILKFHPDIITVSYVVNDVDRHRFYRSNGKSDKELSPKNSFFIHLENLLDRCKFFRAWERIVLQAKGARSKFSGIKGNMYLGDVRVFAQDYKNNLNAIINIARQSGIKVALIKMPVNSPLSKRLLKAKQHRADEYISRGLDYFRSNKIDMAIKEFKKAAIYNPRSSKALFYLGVSYETKKEFVLAEECLQKVKDIQALQCREDIGVYNEIMEKVAKQNGVPLVDVVSAFAKSKGKKLFTTPIHPNAMGHKIIAAEIYNTLLKYNLLSKNYKARRFLNETGKF